MSSGEISIQRLEAPEVGALEAFARLRRYTPERGTFLFEALDPSHEAGRYSIVGYRVRGGYSTPPNVDAVEVAAECEGEDEPESFAAALSLGSVGAFSSCIASMRHGVRLFGDEGPSGTFNAGATVMVFDHESGAVTVAGPKKGRLVPRLIHELEHGEDAEPLAEGGGEPKGLRTTPSDDKIDARAARARSFLDGDDLSEVMLSQTYSVDLGEGDAFDAYRALRASTSAPFAYFLDFGRTPVAAPQQVLGVADEILHHRRRGESTRMTETVRERLPHARTLGAQAGPDALRIIRKLEEGSREVWGGAVGYLCPGGEAMLLLADRMIHVVDGSAEIRVGAPVRFDREATGLGAELRKRAEPLLAALAAAQR